MTNLTKKKMSVKYIIVRTCIWCCVREKRYNCFV